MKLVRNLFPKSEQNRKFIGTHTPVTYNIEHCHCKITLIYRISTANFYSFVLIVGGGQIKCTRGKLSRFRGGGEVEEGCF